VPAIEKYDASGKLLADYFEFGSYSIFDENLEGDAPRGRKASLRTWNYSQQRTYRIYDGYRERQRSSF
jgi:hypothetical protein